MTGKRGGDSMCMSVYVCMWERGLGHFFLNFWIDIIRDHFYFILDDPNKALFEVSFWGTNLEGRHLTGWCF